MKTILDRNIPELLPREQMLSVLLENVYGYLPSPPTDIRFEVDQNTIANFCAGKARCDKVTAICSLGDDVFSFPFYAVMPTDDKKHPFLFISISATT